MKLAIALLLLAGACTLPALTRTPTMSYTVAVSPDFTAEQTAAVLAGVDQWTTAAPGLHLTAQIAACSDATDVCIRPNHAPWAQGYQGIGADVESTGRLDMYTDRIALDAPKAGLTASELLQRTAAHEMGHALGLYFPGRADPLHGADGTLMAAEAHAQTNAIQGADLAAFYRVRP